MKSCLFRESKNGKTNRNKKKESFMNQSDRWIQINYFKKRMKYHFEYWFDNLFEVSWKCKF